MPKRILILTNRIPFPQKDGGAMAMDAMVKGYASAGWQVFLLAMNTTRHFVAEEQVEKLYNELYGFETVLVNNDINYISLLKNLFFSKQPEHADRFHAKNFDKRLKKVLTTFNPDVVQVESIYLNTYLDTIRGNSTALLVQRLHNIEYQIWQRLAAETVNPVKKKYLESLSRRIRHFEQEAWKDADVLLPITNEDSLIITYTGCNTKKHVTPFGIEPARIKYGDGKEEWAGYHIGLMDWMPNIEAVNWFVREVWPVIHKKVPAFRFSFAGRHMPGALYENLPDGVVCEGEVPDAAAFAAGKKILIVPLRSAGGIRVKTLQAMAGGKLVISTTVGMQGIDAIPGIHYQKADTADEFAIAIEWLMNNKAEAEEIIANAQQLIRKTYNQDIIMHSLDGFVLKQLAAHNKQH
jgi:glycosyltransferase involved in cell wall biosynthesis